MSNDKVPTCIFALDKLVETVKKGNISETPLKLNKENPV